MDHCGCGCGHDHDHDHGHDVEVQIINLELDDGTVMECIVVGNFELDNKEYIGLLPKEEDKDEVYLYEIVQENDEEFSLKNIEDDDEFERVGEEFERLFVVEE